jgi:hypothetical protein
MWLGLMLLAAVLSILIWPFSRTRLAIFLCCSYPFVADLIIKQDLPFIVLIFAATERFRTGGRPLLAGAVLALALMKWHFIILIPLVLLIRREIRLLAGFAAGSAALLAISFADAGLGWPLAYMKVLRGEMRFGTPGEWVTLHSLALHYNAGVMVEVLASLAIVAVVCIVLWQTRSFEYCFATALVGGFLLCRHACIWDSTILLPSLTWLSSRTSLVGTAAVALLLPPISILPRGEAAWMIAVLLIGFLAMLLAESRNEAGHDVLEAKQGAEFDAAPVTSNL